jgi:hypothetical protein
MMTSHSNAALVGKRFTVMADAHVVKWQGHINAEVQPGVYLVEVDDKLHLVPIASMMAGSLELGPGSWVFE